MASSAIPSVSASTPMLSHAQLAAMEEWAFLTHTHQQPQTLAHRSLVNYRQHRYRSIPAYNFQQTLSTIPESSLVLFPEWCQARSLDAGKHPSYAAYLREVDLLPYEGDPANYPGLYHFLCMIHWGTYRFDDLKDADKASIHWILNKFYESRFLADFGAVGDVVGGRWKILATLATDSGDCNRGIHRVQEHAQAGPTRLMKVLSSDALHPGYSAREISILTALRGGSANIVQSYDSHVPGGRHELPWLVMEMCNAQSLYNCAKKYWNAQEDMPELFIWHVLIGLLDAVEYCHSGPAKGKWDWDPIYHRDITLSNVLLHWPTDDRTDYPHVKLADFGCAVTRSEATAKQLKIADMPEVGTVIKELMDKDHDSHQRQLVRTYSKKLQYLADCCTINIAAKRPDSTSLLCLAWASVNGLLAAGSIKYEELRGD